MEFCKHGVPLGVCTLCTKEHLKKEWQGLSISEEDGFIVRVYDANTDEAAHQVVLDIEQALKEKNHG